MKTGVQKTHSRVKGRNPGLRLNEGRTDLPTFYEFMIRKAVMEKAWRLTTVMKFSGNENPDSPGIHQRENIALESPAY
jgi:hypothetical protein